MLLNMPQGIMISRILIFSIIDHHYLNILIQIYALVMEQTDGPQAIKIELNETKAFSWKTLRNNT